MKLNKANAYRFKNFRVIDWGRTESEDCDFSVWLNAMKNIANSMDLSPQTTNRVYETKDWFESVVVDQNRLAEEKQNDMPAYDSSERIFNVA